MQPTQIKTTKQLTRSTIGSSGYDLETPIDFTLKQGTRMLIKTGISLQIPLGYEAQIRSRSGLANKYGIVVLNSPGTIDSDYRGDVGVILYNCGDEDVDFVKGNRIAQIVFCPVVCEEDVEMVLCGDGDLDESVRNTGGFGSTGI